MRRRLVLLGLLLTMLINLAPASSAGAVSSSDWKAGRIIDDTVFTDGGSMSTGQIQDFLNSKVGTGTNGIPGQCDTSGARKSELGGGTRAQYGAANGNPAPFTCLKDYYEVPKTTPSQGIPANNYGGKAIPAGAKSAAQIISDAARQYNISPKVLLVKLGTESAGPLTSDDWPMLRQYTYAMGAHCPDSGPGGSANCDSNYAGFSIQMYKAAELLRYYLDSMNQNWWPYKKPYQTNNILWNVVERGCGGSNVYIETSGTAALYTYTPYQPNRAALNNMYGTGDNCSAYGNRNFWRVFNDWFGPTLMNSSFLRTVDNATLYLVSGNNKYPISDINLFNALYPLGGVGFVSQSYLDTKTTAQTLGRTIRSSDGTIYFYDAGIRLPFGSCAQIAAYGSDCGAAVQLQDYQINQLNIGPQMSNVLATTSGKVFYMDGKKREVYDTASLAIVGMQNASINVLNESALNGLEYGAPIIRANTAVKSRSDAATLYLYNEGTSLSPVNQTVQAGSYYNKIPNKLLDQQSIDSFTKSSALTGYLKSSDGSSFIVTESGKYKLTTPNEWSTSFSPVPDGILNLIPTVQEIAAPYLMKTGDSGTVYYVSGGSKRAVQGWSDVLSLTNNPTIITVPNSVATQLPEANGFIGSGNLVKTPNDATVYLIDGLNRKIPLNSFAPASELGFTSLRVVSDSVLSGYTTTNYLLSSLVSCNSKQGVAMGGTVYSLAITGASYINLDQATCQALRWSETPPSFLLAPNGTIYQLSGTQKRPIGGYQTYLSLGGSSGNTVKVVDYTLSLFTTGPNL